ncbi:hypothetical protein N9427_04230 [Paracoccaceae bacterium]|nr:hypothetical protein [Paracoccaceae bacterium]
MKLEQGITEKFDEIGFGYTREFQIPDLPSKKRIRLDLFINFRTRAFIEIKLGQLKNDSLARTAQLFGDVYHQFNRTIVPILVTSFELNETQKKYFSELPVHFISYETIDKNSGRKVATTIRNAMAHRVYPYNLWATWNNEFASQNKFKEDLKEKNAVKNAGKLSSVLISLRPLMSQGQFKTLENEISAINAELETGHFTTGALRVGRALEFVVYILARSWGVKIDKLTIKFIEDLRSSFGQFENLLIDYLQSDTEEKKLMKKRVQKTTEDIVKKISSLGYEIDDAHDLKEVDVPININSILRNVKKQFGKSEYIRKELDLLFKEDLVAKLYTFRNHAAHADTSGESREITEQQLEEMIDYLQLILFRFVNISALVGSVTENK